MIVRRIAAGLGLAACLAMGVAAPANAAPRQEGLINVNVTDVAIPVQVAAPIGVAANVCNVAANVLAEDRRNGDTECDATAESANESNQFLRRAVAQGETVPFVAVPVLPTV